MRKTPTTTSELLVKKLPEARLFDTERVGELLGPILADVPCDDFQEWDPWRGLVVETAARVLDYAGGTLVIPQSVLVEKYWDEIAGGLTEPEARLLVDLILTVKRDVAMIWIEHVVHALVAVADSIVVLNFGRKIAEGESATVMTSAEVREVYMGVSVDGASGS